MLYVLSARYAGLMLQLVTELPIIRFLTLSLFCSMISCLNLQELGIRRSITSKPIPNTSRSDENRQMYVRNFFISSELEINELFLLTGQQESRYKQNIVERPTDCLITENTFFLYLQAELFLALEPLYHQ